MAKQTIKTKPERMSKPESSKPVSGGLPFVFDKTNYAIMIVGVVIILFGFLLMSGGKTADPNVFPADEIYSFRRITLAPIIVLIGFGIEIFAILKRPNQA